MSSSARPQVVISGAGLAGALQGIYFAKQGFDVEIFEMRPDMRSASIAAGKSINLALSDRGMDALARVGVLDDVMKLAIPMYARAIHGAEASSPIVTSNYSKDGTKHINSVSRGELNCHLLTAAEAAGVRVQFEHKCTNVDLKQKTVTFAPADGEGGWARDKSVTRTPALLVGADGAFSAVRGAMQRTNRFNYSQSYLEHGYKELTIPPTADGGFALEKERLHIWPRGSLMMIALPNLDASFTCTLFAPFSGRDSFAELATPDDVRAFFDRVFPDAVPHMPTLVEDFFANPTSSLCTVRCSPWSRGDFACLLGDAAHAVVPFFGQGMNAAFEDCVALTAAVADARAATPDAWLAPALARYNAERIDNANAIADMALENFIEMRDKTADEAFLFRKEVAHLLGNEFPQRFLARYERVSFSLIPYTEAVRIGLLNDIVLDRVIERAGERDLAKIDLEFAKQLCEEHLPLID
eukprot:TRINITY_DN2612_c0_g1_i1.p2 TRINITY_DN2612_c0_g1~~TRINITY_DN2612_c0_g1_i1.p2  ORF type:complete len:482 (-),score=267.20 TRINITY_DN2612_c0_g1_i1:37-1443(-)